MSYHLVSSAGLMTVEFSGTLTREELLAAWQEMEEEEQRQSRAPDRLYLLPDVLEWHITAADIQQHAERRRATRLQNHIKSAIVVQRNSHAAAARIFALYSNDLPQITVRVFATVEDAYAWLEVL
jgi:hypothetical protein